MSTTTSEYERIFIGNRQIDLTHFYSVGHFGPEGYEHFAAGYFYPDGAFTTTAADSSDST